VSIGTFRLLSCLLLTVLVLCQAGQAVHHTCAVGTGMARTDAGPSLDTAREVPQTLSPACLGCALASHRGTLAIQDGPAIVASDSSTNLADDASPANSPVLARALLPRPPPSNS
jgi:hypothetical protein